MWDYLEVPKLRGRARTIVLGLLVAFIAWMIVMAVWKQVGWQNDVRELFGMESTSPTTWPVILLTTVAVAALVLVVSRSLRVLFGKVAGWLGRRLPRRLAWVLGVSALLVLFWVLLTGVLVKGFFAGANVMFSLRDTDTPPTVSQPVGPSAPAAPRPWPRRDALGRQGRIFTGWAPRAEQINTFSGGGAKEPIRAYVGLKSADTLQARADLLLRELQRTAVRSIARFWCWRPRRAPGSWTRVGWTRSSTCSTATPRSPGCSTPSCPVFVAFVAATVLAVVTLREPLSAKPHPLFAPEAPSAEGAGPATTPGAGR